MSGLDDNRLPDHYLLTTDGDVEHFDMEMTEAGDVFYDTNNLFADDADLLSLGMSDNTSPLSQCESSVSDAGSSDVLDTLLSQAGIYQPAERQIRLHSELAHHLSSSPDSNVSVKPQSLSSGSELVRVLTSDDGGIVRLQPPQHDSPQHVPVMSSAVCNSDVSLANSQLVKQLSLITDDVSLASNTGCQQQQQQRRQRVALVEPSRVIPSSSSLLVHQAPQPAVISQQPTLSVNAIQPSVSSVARHVVITTKAPAQTQQVQHISIEQLQQVPLHLLILS